MDWPILLGPAARLRWFIESPPRRRLILRFFATTLRLLVPFHFWRRVTRDIPVRPGRLALWLFFAFCCAYSVTLFSQALSRYHWISEANAMGMTEPLLPYGSKLEFFAPTIYDQGETAPTGKVAPLWFPDRHHPSLAAASLAAGLILLSLVPSRRAAGVTPRHVLRVTTYGLAPAFMIFVMLAVWMVPQSLSLTLTRSSFRWMGYIAQAESWLTRAWLVVYWWTAVRSLRLPRAAAAVILIAALLAGASVFFGNWRWWAARMHAL